MRDFLIDKDADNIGGAIGVTQERFDELYDGIDSEIKRIEAENGGTWNSNQLLNWAHSNSNSEAETYVLGLFIGGKIAVASKQNSLMNKIMSIVDGAIESRNTPRMG